MIIKNIFFNCLFILIILFNNVLCENKISVDSNILLSSNSTTLDNTPLKVALCTIGKKENRYAREYVEYYKNLGLTKIFLYDNNDLNDEKFEEVINDYIENGFVNIINKRGEISIHSGNIIKNPTFEVFSDCYYKNYKNYDWLFFFDMDEFLSIDYRYNNIFEFLNDFKEYDGIKVQWRVYGDNGKLHYENKPVIERFKDKNNMKYSTQVKCILKCKEYPYELKFNEHGIFNKEPYIVNVMKIRIIPEPNVYPLDLTNNSIPYNNLPVYLDHFQTKSTKEYIERQYHSFIKAFNWDYYSFREIKRRYFNINKTTKKKLRLFKKFEKKIENRKKELEKRS